MELKANPIGKYITPINEKNKENKYSNVLGVAIEKEFIPSVANLIDTDLSKYSVLRKGRFAFNPMHVGRDMKLPIAMYKKVEPALVSPAYSMFEVNSDEILPEYLELILKSSEFDHLCWFHTDASVRGGLSWDDFADLKIAVPSIQEQEKIVHNYKVVVDRIELLKNINYAIEKTCLIIYKKLILNNEPNSKLSDLIVINPKSKIQVNNADPNGIFPFFTSGENIFKDSNVLVEGLNLFVNTGGKFDVKFYEGKASYSTDTLSITSKNDLTYYLYLFLKDNYSQIDETCFHGSALQHLQKDEFLKLNIYIPNTEEIDKYICKINKLMKLVIQNKKEIVSLINLKTTLLSTLTKEV